jgi:hypothetical protein
MFCNHIVQLYYHGIPKCGYSLQKFKSYMTRLPLVIQKMNNKKKCINTSPWYLKIKRYSACITWLKGWRNKSFFCLLNNHRQKWFLNFCLNGKFNRGFFLRINLLKKKASINDKGISSFVMNNTRFFSNCFFMKINIFIIRNIITQTSRTNVKS